MICFAAATSLADRRFSCNRPQTRAGTGAAQSCYHRQCPPGALSRTVPIESIRSRIAADLQAVDALIRASLHSEVALVRQVAEHIIAGGGKRLRPALVVLSAGAFGYQGDAHHRLAGVIEFIHTATLLHDDVVDESSLRRGRATSNALFGNAASVLVGDFLYSRAFQMMVQVGSLRVMEVLADATNVIAEGEVLQLMNCHNADVDEAGYLRVVRCKTAKLFEAAMRLGAVISDAAPVDEEAMATYGMHLGIAFQLIDDVLDYSGSAVEMGKNVGDDLCEGKPTLPLIYAMRNGSPAAAARVREAIERGGIEELNPVLDAIRHSGALEYTRAQAEAQARVACDAIDRLPRSKHLDSLLELARFAVERNF
jgi:octaprenyl-diphosphate synthase